MTQHIIRHIACSLALACSCLLATQVSASAAQTAGLVGKTVDCGDGSVLPHAHVQLRIKGNAVPERDLVSDAQGHFQVLGLQPGWYAVNVRAENGYWGPHNIKLNPDAIEHVLVGATNDVGHRCVPYTLPQRPQTTDQTTLD